MKLNGIDFGHVLGQSGIQGFFGRGDEYRHHAVFKFFFGWLGFSFKGMTFTAKTMTLQPRIYPESSNTELRDGYKLKYWFPSSIWVSFRSFIGGYVLNAVGLANPGASALLDYGFWHKRREPFQLSFMPMSPTLEGKLAETREFCQILDNSMSFHKTVHPYAVQVNFSCPNTGHDQKQDPAEIIQILKVFQEEMPEVAIIPKFDLLISPETIVALKPYCDAFMIGNTIPFGKLEDEEWWKEYFPNGSPILKHFGGKFSGGLSGTPLFMPLYQWLCAMDQVDPTVKIIAGGGIMEKADIMLLSGFKCVKAVALGSVAILRPWRLQGLISYGNEIFNKKEKQHYGHN